MENSKIELDIINHAIDKLKDRVGLNDYGCDLHNTLFNQDYFIVGYYDSEQWLIKNCGIFNAIEIIQTYEKENFGETTTDISNSERVVNMYAYIQGEKLLNQSKTLQKNWDIKLTEKNLKKIIAEISK